MEQIIAQLLDQFEGGRMSRRQLIHSLAVAAAAEPVALGAVARTSSGQTPAQMPPAQTPPSPSAAATSPTPAPGSGPAPWKTVWLDHISYSVAGYERSAAFYTSLMGWDIRSNNGTSQATLGIGNIGEIIIRNRRQPASGPDSPQPGRPPLTGVIDHISFGIQPWNAKDVEAELKRRGLSPRPDMAGGGFESFHVIDPDGWDLQISNKTGDR